MSERAIIAVVGFFLAAAMGIAAILAGGTSTRTGCFEDEAALWDGEAHTVCVPLDDLTD